MRISDWSSDVCSSDLTGSTRTKGWRDRGFVADNPLGDDIRLVIGVLDRLKPDLGAFGKVVHMRRAVADRIHVGQARLTEAVDEHAVGAVRTRRDKRFDRGHDDDTEADEGGGEDLP